MESKDILNYYNRTVERLADLLRLHAANGENHCKSWITKKLIEDNKSMATLLKIEIEKGREKNVFKSASY